MLRRLSSFALPFALVLGVGLADGLAQGIMPSGPAPVEAPPDASTAGPVAAPSDAPSTTAAGAGAEAANPQAGGNAAMTPPDLVAAMPEKGSLKNPYTDYKSVSERGHKLYMNAGCNGCHGGGGGGGMCPPLTNDVWVYGSSDDTLFRLITIGSDELAKLGYTRTGRENVKGPMPAHGEIVKTQDDLWKIISWIRTVYKYDPKGQPWAR